MSRGHPVLAHSFPRRKLVLGPKPHVLSPEVMSLRGSSRAHGISDLGALHSFVTFSAMAVFLSDMNGY